MNGWRFLRLLGNSQGVVVCPRGKMRLAAFITPDEAKALAKKAGAS